MLEWNPSVQNPRNVSVLFYKQNFTRSDAFDTVIGGDARRLPTGSNIDFLFDRRSSGLFSLLVVKFDERVICFRDTRIDSVVGVVCPSDSS